MITQAIYELISNHLVVPLNMVQPDVCFEALDADSLDVADLLTHVNEKFSLKIAAKSLQYVETVGQFCDLVEREIALSKKS